MTPLRKLFLTIVFLGLAIVLLSVASGNASADTHTLAGSGNADAGATWDTGTAPEAGDDLVLTGAYNLALNQAITYGDITLAAEYSGIATQGAVNFGYHNLTIHAGTWTGVVSKDQTCSGSFIQDGGTVTNNVLRVIMSGDGETISVKTQWGFNYLHISANITYTSSAAVEQRLYNTASVSLLVDAGKTLTIPTGKTLRAYCYGTGGITVLGSIAGGGTVYLDFSTADLTLTINEITAPTQIFLTSGAAASHKLTLAADATFGSLQLKSNDATKTMTIDTNDKDLAATSFLIGARGILLNSGSASVVTVTSLDSSNAAAVFTGDNIKLTMKGSSLKMKATDRVESVSVDYELLVLYADTNITSDLSFIGLTTSHPHGWYENGTRVSSVTTDANGTYSLGSGIFAWDNATLKITPVITIDLWEHTDTFRNTIWQGYEYWADHDCDLLVTWSMTASEDWLTIDDTGNITGTPDEDGTCYYTITVTYSNGETATISGYVDVVTSATQSASMTMSALLGALVLVLIVSSLMVMFNRSQRS